MRVSALIDAIVRDADGRRIGRVTEVRASGEPPRVAELLLGRTGIRHRLTGRDGATHAIAFDRIDVTGPGQLRADPRHRRTL